MRKEKILKLMLVLVVAMGLILMSTNVFALSYDDLTTDLSGQIDLNTDTNTDTDTSTNTDTTSDTNTSTDTETTNTNTSTNTETNTNTNNYNTDLPEAGLAENTILVAGIIVLAIIAICAYKKFKYYKNV